MDKEIDEEADQEDNGSENEQLQDDEQLENAPEESDSKVLYTGVSQDQNLM